MPGSSHVARSLDRRLTRRQIAGTLGAAGAFAATAGFHQGYARQGHGISTTPGTGPEKLRTMLGMVPAAYFDLESSDGLVWAYADIAGQLDALGIPMPVPFEPLPEGYVNATYPLVIWSRMFSYALDEEFVGAIGFSPFIIEQEISAGLPPAVISINTGFFDRETMIAAWEGVGYELTESRSGAPYWSLGDGTFDIEHPIQRRVISSMNNLALVDDMLITAGTIAGMELVLATIEHSEPSLADHAGTMQGVEALLANTVSAAGFNPALLYADVDTTTAAFVESDDAVGPMPPIASIVTSITAGLRARSSDESTPVPTPDHAAGEGLARIVLVTGSEDEASVAAAVAGHRWTTSESERIQRPLNDLMHLESATPEGATAILTFTVPGPQRVWFDILLYDDAFPFMPSSED
ncbi:MAG TPA: hypothetical protein VD767_07315 [Thermomicrobiales bacterium]|nr:hypothetical protein [Thermomicrobiales bacterium]